MSTTRYVASIFSAAMMIPGADMVYGQDYPSKPIHIITTGTGGGGDLVSRIVAQGISGPLGQPVIVDNRAGAIPAAEAVAKSPPDGYALHMGGGALWTRPLLSKMPWDPEKSFSSVTVAISTPNVVAIHPSLPVKSIKELIALAKARPGELNYGATPSGSIDHLSAELFKSMAGVNIVGIFYKTNGQYVQGLLRGEVQMAFGTRTSVAAHLKSGRLKALAVASAKPSALNPDLPTMIASGLPGYVSETLVFLVAPAKTPDAIIRRLNQETVRVLNRPDVKETFFKVGAEVVASSPEQMDAEQKAYVARMSKVIKDAGIKDEPE